MRLRVRNGWAVSVLLASVGCGQTHDVSDTGGGAAGAAAGMEDEPPAMALDFARSGSRLVALGYSSNEAKVFRTFHDATLGFDCSFVPEAVGAFQRCVPNVAAPLVFTDAGCTEPAAWDESASIGEGWAVGDAVSIDPSGLKVTCPGDAPPHREVYRVAEQLTDEVIGSPDLPLFELRDARCQTAFPPAKVTPPVHRLVPMAETELVRGRRASLDVGGGLRLTRLIAEDGAELSLGVTGADGTPCELQREGECVPEPIARPSSSSSPLLSGGFWSALNADCSVPTFQGSYEPACGVARFGVQDDGVAPLRVTSLTNVTALFSLEMVVPVTDPLSFTCNPRSGASTEQAWAPGRDLTGTLPSASRLQRGSGPLRVNWYSMGQSVLLPVLADLQRTLPGVVPSAEFVTDAGLRCEIRSTEDGTEHCAVVDDPSNPIGDLSTTPVVVWGPL